MTSKDESKQGNYTKDGKWTLSLIPCAKRLQVVHGTVSTSCMPNEFQSTEAFFREPPVN